MIVWGEGSEVTELGSEMSNRTTVLDGKEKGESEGAWWVRIQVKGAER